MQDALIDLVSLDKDIRHQRDPAFCFFDEAEPEPASKFSGAAELLRFIIVEFFPRKVFRLEAARIAGTRLMLAGWMLQVGPFANLSLSKIAKKLKVSRAVLSAHVRGLERAGFPHGRQQKSFAAREKYRVCTAAAWRKFPGRLGRKRKPKKTATAPLPDSPARPEPHRITLSAELSFLLRTAAAKTGTEPEKLLEQIATRALRVIMAAE
jgi:DNA-binding Lrp family transcriptional regulator